MIKTQLIQQFHDLFDTLPLLAFAPGRINLIGEHTDYQEGFALPAAIQNGIWVGIQKNHLPYCRVYSLDFQEEFTFDWKAISPKKGHWGNYVLGYLAQIFQAGYPFEGFDMIVGGTLPRGAGLSSSAAFSVAVGTALSGLFDLQISPLSIARYAQQSEHQFIGVNCGLMDPYTAVFGKKDTALLLDCRYKTHQEIPINMADYGFLLVNSTVSHHLADSAYNARRASCEESVELLKKTFPSIETLRDIPYSDLYKIQQILPTDLFKKAHHVITECIRVTEAAKALQSGDLFQFGKLLNASHQSLQKNYEVSCPELDFLANKAQQFPGVLGSRMMGGGFGGCTLNVVHLAHQSALKSLLQEAYFKEFGKEPIFIEVAIGEGTFLEKQP